MLRHKQLVDTSNRRLIDERRHHSPLNNEDDAEDFMWRQAARMSNDDERLLQFEVEDRPKRSTRRDNTGPVQTQFAPSAPQRKSPTVLSRADNLDDEDENSSISLAQSGCHSILSAWRIKSANRAARSRQRPLSVLSNGSSTGKKSAASTVFTLRGKSPASQSRIALGPRAAQHFVTNSRRRRQANELILTTLEARRRTLALNRQNASLLGSATYLADPTTCDYNPLIAPDELSARLSLSPSPVSPALLGRKSPCRRTPSPAQRSRPAMSDIGGLASAAAHAQRQRLLLNSANTKAVSPAAPNARRPPLARIDQNSSDLCSSNSSSSSESTSSGSQFTQLVTSELAPDCALLDRQVERQSPQHNIVTRLVTVPTRVQKPQVRPKPRIAAAKVTAPTPQVPERTRKKQHTRSPSAERCSGKAEEEDESDQVSKLRRGALRRDSIRRVRLSRAPPKEALSSSDVAPSSSESTSSVNKTKQERNSTPSQQAPELKQLPTARRLDIESNPFLNRGHFRSSINSARSNLSHKASESAAGEERGTQCRESKRDSSLFGSMSGRRAESAMRAAANQERAAGASRARSLSEAREFNSSESIREQNNKTGSQQEGEQTKQVESMLRSARPNQVFTSYSRESESMMKSQNMTYTSVTSTAAGQPRSNKTSAAISLSIQNFSRTQNITTGERSPTPRSPSRRRQVGEERIVCEVGKSHDESKLEPSGSRRERAMQEKWGHEKSAEEERLELIRATSISPPAGFEDSSAKPAKASDKRLQRRAISSDSPRASAPAVRQRKPLDTPSKPANKDLAAQATGKDLPTFERTADDEFRKRVDYLRKLARSNLADSTPSDQERRRPIFTTRPMTTNWRRDAASEEKPKEPCPPASPKPPVARRGSHRSATITNLDALLIADRYQPPINSTNRELSSSSNFNWRRSNSSLASLNTERSQPARQDSRLNPTQESEVSQQHTLALRVEQPHEQTTPAAIKLVVKEKSAPKLDYAVVEKQPVVQHVRQSTDDESSRVAPRLAAQSQALTKQANNPQARTSMQLASPRSPDLGAVAVSSNDDSAIASSVSSPSLSFMTNPPTPRQYLQNATSGRRVLPTGGQHSGALQSILRRQQYQQQQSQLTENSDHPTQVDGQAGNQATSVKRGLGNQELQEPLFRSNARSPEPVRPPSPNQDKALPALQQTQQQPTPPKRVHFNDRTSIRSFESVSSLASNSTAIPSEMLRQQIGSPDSMGSESASRLSADSPDESRRGAAIYAIRGDPELEQAQQPGQHQHQQLQQPARYHPQHHINAQPVRYEAPPAAYQPLVSPLVAAPVSQHRGPYLRMNAPASIAGPAHQPHLQYIVRPTSLTSTRIVPNSMPANFRVPDDDDDPDYALRLRQAATSRTMFNYVPTAPPAQLRQPLQLSPQQRQRPTGRVLHLNDLANFQTEV